MTYRYERPRLGRRRFGEPIVTFSTPWPPRTHGHLYIVSEFTAFFPGRVELRRVGHRGVATLDLWEGRYHYAMVDSLYNVYEDYEVPISENLKFMNLEVPFRIADVGLEELRRALEEGGEHPELIVHDERWPSFISGYGGITVVRVFTVRDEVEEVTLNYMANGSWHLAPAERAHRDDLRDYYEAIVEAPVLAYYFTLRIGGREVPFGVDGIGSPEPWRVDPGVLSRAPPWFVGTSYYLIFPDSFAGARNVVGSRPRERLGGNLWSASERLNHVNGLGLEAIYLTPVYVAGSYHNYDVIDHESVEKELGGPEAMREFLEKAHSLGLRVVVDIVAHHTSPCAKEFLEALSAWKSSRYWSWYRFLVNDLSELPSNIMAEFKSYIDGGCGSVPPQLKDLKPFYEAFYALWSMPKLNHDNPEVVEHLCHVIKYWLSEGADGIRVDVAHGLPFNVMRRLYECAKEIKDDAVVIMELMAPVWSYRLGIEADSAMNYEARGHILRFVNGDETAKELVDALNRQYLALPLQVSNSLYNLLGSHDTERLLTAVKDKRAALKALSVEFLMYGSPSVYYGDEVGLRGDRDPDNRLPMVWDESRWDKELLSYIKALALLRRSYQALRVGLFRAVALTDDLLLLLRLWRGSAIAALVSRKPTSTDNLHTSSCKELLSYGRSGNSLDGFLILYCEAQGFKQINSLLTEAVGGEADGKGHNNLRDP